LLRLLGKSIHSYNITMSLIIETDLKEVLSKLDGKIDKLDEKIDRMQDSITDLKLGQSELKGDLKSLNTKVDNLEKTVDRIQKDVDLTKTEVAGLTGIKGLLIPLAVAVTVSAINFALTHMKLP
jgi:chromosome segregation ATPase